MQPLAIGIAIAVTAALLLAEHIGMWSQPWRLERPWNYVAGVLTLALGWVIWGLAATDPIAPIDAAVSIILISFGSGAVIVLCYAVRGRLERAKTNSAVIAKAKYLTQDLIDQGDRHVARQSDLHDRSRNN